MAVEPVAGEALRKGQMGEQVSVVATVRDEGEEIRLLVHSLIGQSRQPDEVVICDGGSTDNTLSLLQDAAREGKLPLRVFVKEGANISRGRNAAIARSRGALIAVTDAGVQLDPEWLSALIAPFEEGPRVQVVSGFFLPHPQSPFEAALGWTTLPALADIDPGRFLPSSRSVAFRREAWESVGGYPEWIDYCEDLLFDLALRERYGPFTFAPRAVAHFRPRPNLAAFFRQYYRYARGDGKADLWRKRYAARYLTYLVALPLLILLSLLHTPLWLLPLLTGGAIMFYTPYKRLPAVLSSSTGPSFSLVQTMKAILWVPVIRVTGDVAKMIGYPVGVWWRWRHRDQVPVHYPRR